MTTIQEAKDVLFQTIAEGMGKDAAEGDTLVSSVNAFTTFIEDMYQVLLVEEITEKLLSEYRIYVRCFSGDEEEFPQVCAVAAFLCSCIDEGWLPETLLKKWNDLSPNDFYIRDR